MSADVIESATTARTAVEVAEGAAVIAQAGVVERTVTDMGSVFSAPRVVVVSVGSTATEIELTVKEDGVPKNLSAATGPLLWHSKRRDGTGVVQSGVAAWRTNGSDGVIYHQVTAAEVASVGELLVEFEVQGFNGGNLVLPILLMKIADRAKV